LRPSLRLVYTSYFSKSLFTSVSRTSWMPDRDPNVAIESKCSSDISTARWCSCLSSSGLRYELHLGPEIRSIARW
jgi:hypothetical protein